VIGRQATRHRLIAKRRYNPRSTKARGRHVASAIAAVHPRDRRPEGPHGRRRLEFQGSRTGVAAYTEDSRWRNRSEFFEGRAAIVAFLTRKWAKEHEYRLIKDLWAFDGNHIVVRFQYEWHDDGGQWHRSYGNEQWEFDAAGLMRRREASINDVAIAEKDRRFRWAAPGSRPADVPGLGESPF
jgi:nuclear transport factor 2 (NTF2) superfamily protein